MRFDAGAEFAGYTIVSPLGRGGMASVYLVREPGINRLVALKVLPVRVFDDAQFAERFEQEAQVVGALDHPSIIPLYRFGITDGIAWMALRYVDGGDFSAKLRAGPLALQDGLSILRGVAAALDYAHSKGVIHRDLKPQNILVSVQGAGYLADFGIAKLLENTGKFQTNNGNVIGTPAYMAPEQAQGHVLGPGTDIYGLAVICFQWLTGSLPFDGDTPHQILFKQVCDPLPPQLLNLVAPAVAAVLVRGLAKLPAERFVTASAMLAELAQALMPRPMRAVATTQELPSASERHLSGHHSPEHQSLDHPSQTRPLILPNPTMSAPVFGPAVLYVRPIAEAIPNLDEALRERGWHPLSVASLTAVADVSQGQTLVAVVVDSSLLAELGEIINALDQSREPGPTPPLLVVTTRAAITEQLVGMTGSADAFLANATAASVTRRLSDLQRTLSSAEPLRVLIVDDDRSQLVYCESVLRRRGLSTQTAMSSREALQLVHSFRPDLILVDLNMPEIDGMALTAQVREMPGTMLVPIIFISGEQDVSKRLCAINVGADDFLTKPVRPAHLIDVVVGRAKRARAMRQQLLESTTPASARASAQSGERRQLAAAPRSWNGLWLLSISVALLALTYSGYRWVRASQVAPNQWKLAVMPLRQICAHVEPNAVANAGDGLAIARIHADLVSAFEQLEEIRLQGDTAKKVEVISTGTMQAYQDSKMKWSAIADELQATHLLESNICPEGAGVELKVSLVDARTNASIWNQSYHPPSADGDMLQSVASDVTRALGLR